MSDIAEPVVEVDPTKPAEELDNAAVGKPGEGEAKPEPGTPDKALQKMQQELGNVTRQLAALTEKKDAGHELSEADKAKLAKVQQRYEKIRQFVSRPDRDELPSEVDPVAEQVLDLTDKVGRVDQLEAELADAKGVIGQLLNEHNWTKGRTKYDGLDVDAIWEKAQTDAAEVLGEDAAPKSVSRLASKYFEDRCEAAKKRKGDEKKPPANNTTSAPSTYKVGEPNKPAPVLSEEQQVMAEALSLVREI